MSSDLLKRVGVFVVFLVAAVAVSGVLTAPTDGGSAPQVEELTVESFSGDDAVATAAEETGELSMSADASGKVVVIDSGHGASIDREKLSPVTRKLTERGATVKYFVGERQGGRTLNETLRGADAYVSFGAKERYTEAQLDGLRTFTDAGGRVLFMNEPSSASSGMLMFFGPRRDDGVTSPMTPVVSQYGMAFDNGYLYNMHDYSVNYRNVYATPASDGPLTEGVDQLVFHESLAVSGGQTVVATGDRTTLSKTREQQSYGVIARSGNVVTVGDTSIVGQEFLKRADNEVLVGNLLDFLVSGDKSPENAPQPPQRGSENSTRPSRPGT